MFTRLTSFRLSRLAAIALTMALFVLLLLGVLITAVNDLGTFVYFAMFAVFGCGAAAFLFANSLDGAGWRVRNHLGILSASSGVATLRDIPQRDRIDLQRALDAMSKSQGGAECVLGVGMPQASFSYGGAGLTVGLLLASNPRSMELQWDMVAASADSKHPCVRNALYFLRVDGMPFCVLINAPEKLYRMPTRMEIFATDARVAEQAWRIIEKRMTEDSVYRRKSISLEPADGYEERFDIRLYPISSVPLEQIILPAALLRVIERNTLFFLAQQESLRKAGQRTQRGLLFHGPPGTGKTLVTKYIASICKCTVIVLSGANMAFIREACEYGKRLAPAIIVLEDVDLVAPDRAEVLGNTTLHGLMEAMDGLGPQSDCLFILTTNRPESLEKALASRPGRVDQTFLFPLPEREERRRLFARFSAEVDMTSVTIEPLLDRTDGSSPAFIQELVRKAVMIALERGEKTPPIILSDGDFREAMNEIVLFGGELTRRILGFMPALPDLPLR